MKIKLTKDLEGLVITTRWKTEWNWKKQPVTGIIKFGVGRVQLWYSPDKWTCFEISCDKRSFKILPEEEAIIWRIEHNM